LAAGVALKSTVDPEAKPAEQVVPQSMPAGLLVTLPLPAVRTASWTVLLVLAEEPPQLNRKREPRHKAALEHKVPTA
jgi:hypothetical protein